MTAWQVPDQVAREDLVADRVHIAAVETVIHPLNDRNEVLPTLIARTCRVETVMHLLKGRNVSVCHGSFFPIYFGSCFRTRSARKRHNSRASSGGDPGIHLSSFTTDRAMTYQPLEGKLIIAHC